MLTFLLVVALLCMLFLLWRIADQLPDIAFRLAEIQHYLSELRHTDEHPQQSPPADTNPGRCTQD